MTAIWKGRRRWEILGDLVKPGFNLGRELRWLVGRFGSLDQIERAVGPGDYEHAGVEGDVAVGRLEHVGRDLATLFNHLVGGQHDCRAAGRRGARAKGAAAIGDLVGVALDDANLRGINAELLADDLLVDRVVPLAV